MDKMDQIQFQMQHSSSDQNLHEGDAEEHLLYHGLASPLDQV